MDIIECFTKVGFTRQESTLYLVLCREGKLTGYEAAKIAGISRSNAYLALAGLVEKGAAYKIEGDSIIFTAVLPEELVSNIKRDLNEVLHFIENNVPTREIPPEPFITITGESNIINKMKNIINQAKERIYLSLSQLELETIREDIVEAKNRGLKIVVITSQALSIDGVVVYHNEKQPGQIRLIVDTSYVLTGEIKSSGGSNCLYSKNKNLIELIKDSLTNEIKLIELRNKK